MLVGFGDLGSVTDAFGLVLFCGVALAVFAGGSVSLASLGTRADRVDTGEPFGAGCVLVTFAQAGAREGVSGGVSDTDQRRAIALAVAILGATLAKFLDLSRRF